MTAPPMAAGALGRERDGAVRESGLGERELARAAEQQEAALLDDVDDDCPGRKPAFLVFKRPVRPYKSPIQNGFS